MHNTDNKYCLECGRPRKNKEHYCRHCGAPYPKNIKNNFYKLLLGIGLVTLTSLLIVFIMSINSSYIPVDNQINTGTTQPAKVTEVVVNVYCPFYGNAMSFDSEGYGGSGTVMTDSGIILTNSHVIPQEEELINTNEEGCFVIFPDPKSGAPKEIYLAKPIVLNKVSDKYDLAFLQIYDVYTSPDNEKYGAYPKIFPSLSDESCDQKDIELGEKILVYGYPSSTGGISLTVTEGLVSTFTQDGIYTSAKIDHGNSGGLATDAKGCFIGVPTAVSSGEYESYGIIVPASVVTDFINDVNKLLDIK